MQVKGTSPIHQGDPTEKRRWLEDQILQISHGNKEALASLYHETQASVYAFLLSYLGRQDAEDAVQDTYIALFQSAARYTAGGRPMGWIFGIARNIALMKLRAGRRESTLTEEAWHLIEAPEPPLSFEERYLLTSMMEKLSREEYRIVVLHVATGLKFREISQLLQMPLSTALSKYHRAMKKMKHAWKEEADNE